MTPQHQHLVAIIQQDHERPPVQPDHVMPEPLTTRHLNISLPEVHPRILIDSPLTERPPSPRFVTVCVHHTLKRNV
jgi:hypothetical protein